MCDCLSLFFLFCCHSTSPATAAIHHRQLCWFFFLWPWLLLCNEYIVPSSIQSPCRVDAGFVSLVLSVMCCDERWTFLEVQCRPT